MILDILHIASLTVVLIGAWGVHDSWIVTAFRTLASCAIAVAIYVSVTIVGVLVTELTAPKLAPVIRLPGVSI